MPAFKERLELLGLALEHIAEAVDRLLITLPFGLQGVELQFEVPANAHTDLFEGCAGEA